MEEKKISYDDIFQGDPFGEAANNARALQKVLEELDGALKKIAKENAELVKLLAAQGKSAQNLQKLTQATKQLESATRAQIRTEKELTRLREKLEVLSGDAAKEIFKLRHEVKELTAEQRAAAASAAALAKQQELLQKVAQNSFASYFELTDTLENLRIVYKDLVAAGRGNTEEAKQLVVAITQLDKRVKEIDYSVGQFQRNVGNYAGSMREFFGEVVKEAEKGGGVIGSLIAQIRGLGTAFTAAGGGLRGLAAATQLLGKAIASSGILLLLSLAGEAIGALLEGLKALGQRIGEAFGWESEALQNARAQLQALRERLTLEREVAKASLERRSAELEGADPDRILAATEAEISARERLAQLQIRQAQAEIARQREVLSATLETADKKAEALNRIGQLEEEIQQRQNELTELQLARQEALARAEAERARREEERRRRLEELARAERERLAQLERLLEALTLEREKAKSRVEEIRAERDERLRAADAVRQEALAMARTAEEKLRIEQAYQAKRRQIITQAEREIAEVQSEAANRAAQMLLEVQGQTLEAQITRLRNQYRERYAEIQRLEAELGRELTDLRSALAEAAVRDEIRVLRENVQRVAEERERAAQDALDLEAKRFDSEAEFAKYKERRLAEIRLAAIREQLAALRKLDEDVRDAETQALIRSLEAQEALIELKLRSTTQRVNNTLQEIGKKLSQTLDLLDTLFERAMQRAEMRLDREAALVARRIDLLIARVERGSDSAAESIAALEKREAEIARAQEDLKKRAQRREAALGAFRAYAAQLQQGTPPTQALINVLRDLTLITQAIRALPVFHSGTEYVRPAASPIAGAIQDTVLARLHQGERVVPAHINRQLRGIPNEALPELAQSARVEVDVDSILNAVRVAVRKGSHTNIYRRSL